MRDNWKMRTMNTLKLLNSTKKLTEITVEIDNNPQHNIELDRNLSIKSRLKKELRSLKRKSLRE